MHTAEQARELWCPMARIAFNEPGPFNRLSPDTDGGSGIPRGSQCIANECAMWRWLPNHGEHMADKRKGYCGLAPIQHTTT